jgi:hypothetical protein
MPIPNQPNPTPEVPIQKPEQVPQVNVEQIQSAPEKNPQPISPEKPASETFSDQAAIAVSQTPLPAPASAPNPDPPTPTPNPVSEEEDASDVKDIDKAWVNAAHGIIEKDKDKPYEEEEDSENLQIQYLDKRFGKKVQKDK